MFWHSVLNYWHIVVLWVLDVWVRIKPAIPQLKVKDDDHDKFDGFGW